MEDRKARFDAALQRLASDVASTLAMEGALTGKGVVKNPNARVRAKKNTQANQGVAVDPKPRDPFAILDEVLTACKRKRNETGKVRDNAVSPQLLDQMACFTDKFKLSPYQDFMHYVPRLVNVVTVRLPVVRAPPRFVTVLPLCVRRAQLAEAIPVPGSGAKLPLDLHRIAARCRNSYYAPKKFSAVQLAYSEPRCRVLVFRNFVPFKRYYPTVPLSCHHSNNTSRVFTDTGRLVGTGMLTHPRHLALHTALRSSSGNLPSQWPTCHIFDFGVLCSLGCFLPSCSPSPNGAVFSFAQERQVLWPRGSRCCAPSGSSARTRACTST